MTQQGIAQVVAAPSRSTHFQVCPDDAGVEGNSDGHTAGEGLRLLDAPYPADAMWPASDAGRGKRALIEEIRYLVAKGSDVRPDGLEEQPTSESLALVEHWVESLPAGMALPDVCMPDDGEITLSWSVVEHGERWRASLTVSPSMEAAGYVKCKERHFTEAYFDEDCAHGCLDLPADMMQALQNHWGQASI